jgi:hypothetical protein
MHPSIATKEVVLMILSHYFLKREILTRLISELKKPITNQGIKNINKMRIRRVKKHEKENKNA